MPPNPCGCPEHHDTRKTARRIADTRRVTSPSKRARWTVAACPAGHGWITVRVARVAPTTPRRPRHTTRLSQAW